MLAGFGAVTGDADRPVITPLGRWAVHRLENALPGAADPEICAAELIAEVTEYDDAAQRLEAASEWLEQHHPREILEAAESMSPLLRTVAADLVEMPDFWLKSPVRQADEHHQHPLRKPGRYA